MTRIVLLPTNRWPLDGAILKWRFWLGDNTYPYNTTTVVLLTEVTKLIFATLAYISRYVWQLCATMMSWVGCLLKDSKLFILFAENSQILLKISVIPILLTIIYLVALNLLVNNQLNSSSNSTHHCCRYLQIIDSLI